MRRHYVLGIALVLLALAAWPMQAAAADALQITVVKLTSPASAGSTATLTIKTAAAAECKVTIRYRSVAGGVPLATKTTGDEGTATWSWRVPTEVARGNLPIDVQCTQGDKKGVLTVQLAVN